MSKHDSKLQAGLDVGARYLAKIAAICSSTTFGDPDGIRASAGACQNRRYDARTRGTPEDERRRKRRTLLAKLRRVEARIERDQLTLAQVREVLKATAKAQHAPGSRLHRARNIPQPLPSDSIRRKTLSVANLV